ncbi:unnamed protein product [Gadus morhua 'NCC']
MVHPHYEFAFFPRSVAGDVMSVLWCARRRSATAERREPVSYSPVCWLPAGLLSGSPVAGPGRGHQGDIVGHKEISSLRNSSPNRTHPWKPNAGGDRKIYPEESEAGCHINVTVKDEGPCGGHGTVPRKPSAKAEPSQGGSGGLEPRPL